MSKVIQLRQSETVQAALCEAADLGMKEVVILGRLPDGTYWFRSSPMECAYTEIGMLEAAKQWIIEGINS